MSVKVGCKQTCNVLRLLLDRKMDKHRTMGRTKRSVLMVAPHVCLWSLFVSIDCSAYHYAVIIARTCTKIKL
jgi:hypothetical protein